MNKKDQKQSVLGATRLLRGEEINLKKKKLKDERTFIPDAFTQVGILSNNDLIKIDRAFSLDGIAIITGWKTIDLEVLIPGTRFWENYDRPDVERQFGLSSKGFIAVIELPTNGKIEILLETSGGKFLTKIEPDDDKEALDTVLTEQRAHLHMLTPSLIESCEWGKILSTLVEEVEGLEAKAHIDLALWIQGVGVVVCGWAIATEPAAFYILLDNGHWLAFSDVQPVSRRDVVDAYTAEMDFYDDDVGFFACINDNIELDKEITVVWAQSTGFFKVCSKVPEKASHDVIEFSRKLLEQSTPSYQLSKRFEHHDGPIIAAILEKKNVDLKKLRVERWDFGHPQSRPVATIVVPLYGRWDFVEHQLLEFCTDADINTLSEILYVIDDPAVLQPFLAVADELYGIYKVPFSIVWGHANRGYSGANNLGASAARGRILIFLNSDAFPNRTGWVSDLISQLDKNPDFGVVTPRLLFADGGLQHVGVSFRYDGFYKVWLNDHPLLGLPPEADETKELSGRAAVTGACMAVRREQFDALGGFDTGYLIGDFEDSDLCLKYREAGLRSGYYPGTDLTHLERQSFSGIGSPDFRQKVAVLNAVRHASRWKLLIEQITAEETAGRT